MAAKRIPNIPNNNNGKKSKIKRTPDTQNNRRPVNNRPRNVGASMNIREQTPAKRRSAKETKRINPDSPEIRRSAKRAQGYKIKKKKKGVNRVAAAYTVLFLIVFLTVCAIVSLGFYANLIKTGSPEYDSLKLKMCLEHEVEETKGISVDVEKYMRDGVLYVNMTAISDEFGFVMTGDHEELRFITDLDSGETVRFTLGTPFVEINGTMVRLNGNVIKTDGSVFVPSEFFTDYVSGIQVTLDEEESLISILRGTERNEAGRFDEDDVTFKLKSVTECISISEFELSDEVAARTYFPSSIYDTSADGSVQG